MTGLCGGKLGGNDLFLGEGEPVCTRKFQNLAYVTETADHNLGLDVVLVKESNRTLDGFDAVRRFSSILVHLLQLQSPSQGMSLAYHKSTLRRVGRLTLSR